MPSAVALGGVHRTTAADCSGQAGGWRFRLPRWSTLDRVADTYDRVARLAARSTNSGLNLAHGLVNATRSLQIVVARQRADRLLDLALGLIDLPVALVLVPHHVKPPLHRFLTLNATSLCQRAATAQQPENEEHERDDQQHMNECADRVRSGDSQQPGDQQNHGEGV